MKMRLLLVAAICLSIGAVVLMATPLAAAVQLTTDDMKGVRGGCGNSKCAWYERGSAILSYCTYRPCAVEGTDCTWCGGSGWHEACFACTISNPRYNCQEGFDPDPGCGDEYDNKCSSYHLCNSQGGSPTGRICTKRTATDECSGSKGNCPN